MTTRKNRFYLATGIALLSSMLLWLGCSYKYNDTYSYAKENEPYLEAAKKTAFAALVADDRVKSILKSSDDSAKATLNDLLDKLKFLQLDIDGVAYAALIEAILANSAMTNANVNTTISTVVNILEAIASNDDPTAVASTVKGDEMGETARATMAAYANDRTSETIQAMIQNYYHAIAGSLSSLSSSSSISTAIIYTGSDRATDGADSIDATIKVLNKTDGSTVGDASTETQKSGLDLIALLIDQTTTVLSASEKKKLDLSFQKTMILATAQVIHRSGPGMVQVASVVATRVEKNMIDAGRSQTQITDTTTTIVNIFGHRSSIAEQARSSASSQSDEALTKQVSGELARFNQLISFIDTEPEVSKANDATTKLLAAVSDVKATDLVALLKDNNTSLAKNITNGGDDEDSEKEDARSYKFIYVTQATFEGDLITAATNAGGTVAQGIAAADYLCRNDTNYPGSGTYKALIVDHTHSRRIACTTANCSGGSSEHVDWVLAANTNYRRLDGTTNIDTTNAVGLFTYDLDNAMSPTTILAWTGMMGNWTSRNYDCGGWDGSSTEGDAGDVSSTLVNAVGHTWNFCTGDMSPLICVEQ